MHTCKQIRKELSLSQSQLAQYLNITRSQLTMAEQNRRQLPTHALLRLAKLEKSLHSRQPYPLQYRQQLTRMDTAHKQTHIKKCSVKMVHTQARLAKMQQQHQQCVRILLATSWLMKQLPADGSGKKEQLWLELLERAAMKKLNHCGKVPQAILQLRIAALQQEAEQVGRMQF